MPEAEDIKLRIVRKATAKAEMLEEIAHGEQWKPDTIKIIAKTEKYEVVDPTPEDEDNTAIVKRFYGVILHVVKTEQPSMNDKKKMVPKRILTVLRAGNGLPDGDPKAVKGRKFPETLWLSNTQIDNFQKFLKMNKEGFDGAHFTAVLAEFKVEIANMVKDGDKFTWSKPVITPIRALTDEELAYVQEMSVAATARADRFNVGEDLSALEDEAGIVARPSKAKAEDEDDEEEKAAASTKKAARKREIDEEDEEEEKPKKAKAAPKKKAAADDDEDETPAPKKKATSDDDDDEETPAPKKQAKPSDDDDEEEAAKPKPKKRVDIADDDEEED